MQQLIGPPGHGAVDDAEVNSCHLWFEEASRLQNKVLVAGNGFVFLSSRLCPQVKNIRSPQCDGAEWLASSRNAIDECFKSMQVHAV